MSLNTDVDHNKMSIEEHFKYCIDWHGLPDNPITRRFYQEAYEIGHYAGHSEVWSYFLDYAELYHFIEFNKDFLK